MTASSQHHSALRRTKVVGSNNAAVQVHALLNFNQQKTTTNGFQVGADGKPITAPTTTNSSTSSYTGNGAQAAGVLTAGATSSPTSATSSSTTGTNGTYSSSQTQTTTAVGQVTQTVDQAPGQVETTAVAVLLNSRAVKTSQIPTIRNLVTAAAAGLNSIEVRGLDRPVSALPFSALVKQAAAGEEGDDHGRGRVRMPQTPQCLRSSWRCSSSRFEAPSAAPRASRRSPCTS